MGKKLFLVWLLSEIVFLLSLILFDHASVNVLSMISYSIQWFLFLLSVQIVRHEPIRKNKYIFLNFAIFFSISLLFHSYNFLTSQFARLYFIEYISMGAYFLVLAFALIYLALDALFRDFRVLYKYLLAISIAGGFFAYYYHDVLADPNYLRTTGDAKTYKAIDTVHEAYVAEHGTEPSVETLAQLADLKLWSDGKAIGTLFQQEKLRVVTEFYPYLSGSNYIVLLLRPLYMNAIYMCVLCVAFILLFFGYQYMKDPPQGAYIDKIMFLFLIFCTMEIMHAWSFIKSVEWQSFYEMLNMGYVVSVFVLVLIGVFFGLRLRFIRSVKGEFYEQEILVSPATVTRWRDALDDLLVAHFFNRKAILGRLFVRSTEDS